MKSLILTIILMMGLESLACERLESQVEGVVKNVNVAHAKAGVIDCSYDLVITQFSSQGSCALQLNEARRARLQDHRCFLKEGDFISGKLVKAGSDYLVE